MKKMLTLGLISVLILSGCNMFAPRQAGEQDQPMTQQQTQERQRTQDQSGLQEGEQIQDQIRLQEGEQIQDQIRLQDQSQLQDQLQREDQTKLQLQDQTTEKIQEQAQTAATECALEGSDKKMSISEAKEIAAASECGDQFKETYFCNEITGTWWIDLEMEKEGCAPACVINTETKEAEINWRCTGLIPES